MCLGDEGSVRFFPIPNTAATDPGFRTGLAKLYRPVRLATRKKLTRERVGRDRGSCTCCAENNYVAPACKQFIARKSAIVKFIYQGPFGPDPPHVVLRRL